MEVPYEMPDELYEKILQGDTRCKFRIGTRIKKVISEDGDVHLNEDEGTVRGSILVHDADCYLIEFDKTSPLLSFTIGSKLEEIWNSNIG